MALASANTVGSPNGRPERHLKLVPPLVETAVETAPERSTPTWVRRPVRLTRRGRVVVGVLLVLAVLGFLALLAPPTEAARPAGPPRTITVHQGDTLFSIASRAAPGSPPYAVMRSIQQLNRMTDTTVFVGEQLLLPPS